MNSLCDRITVDDGNGNPLGSLKTDDCGEIYFIAWNSRKQTWARALIDSNRRWRSVPEAIADVRRQAEGRAHH